MRWDKVGAGTAFAAVMLSLLAPYEERDRKKPISYYGYQDLTEQGYEPVTYEVTNTIKTSRGWPSPALVVPVAWAIVLLAILLVALL